MLRLPRVLVFALVVLVGCSINGGECVESTGANCPGAGRFLDCDVSRCVAENGFGDKVETKSSILGQGGALHITDLVAPNTDELQLGLRDSDGRELDVAVTVVVNGVRAVPLAAAPSPRPQRFRVMPPVSGTVTIDLVRTDATASAGKVDMLAIATTTKCRECPQ